VRAKRDIKPKQRRKITAASAEATPDWAIVHLEQERELLRNEIGWCKGNGNLNGSLEGDLVNQKELLF
jgi:hypothetical protein